MVHLLFGLRVAGSDQVPASRPLIFVGNHGSHYDGLFSRIVVAELLGVDPVAVAWCGVRELPIVRHAIATEAIELIFTGGKDGTPESPANALQQMISHLRRGHCLVLNAEGERHDELGRFHPGASYAALQTGVPIVPYTLRGVQPLWKDLPWPGRYRGDVSVLFHAPVDPAVFAGRPWRDAAEDMTAEVRRRVASAIDYPDAFQSKAART